MKPRLAPLLVIAPLFGALAFAQPAQADVLPEPERPAWDEHPAPMPEPPPEKDFARRALPWIVLGLGALASAAALRQRRVERPIRMQEGA